MDLLKSYFTLNHLLRMSNLLKMWSKNSAIRRTFRYAKATGIPLQDNDWQVVHEVMTLLDKCPNCRTKNIPKRYKKFGIETYQQCRSKKSCNNIWYIPYKESIFRDSGPFYKAVAKIISIDYNNDE